MSAAPELATAVTAPGAAARPSPAPRRAAPPALARRIAARLGDEWLPRAAWTISRTGRSGLVGIALLAAATLFLFSTHREVAAEVEALRAQLAAEQRRARTAAAENAEDVPPSTRALPARAEIPAVLRQLFGEATRAGLAVDTAKYEIDPPGASGVVRYHVAFPVTGPYPQVRAFIDATLATIPAIALRDLALERKSIGDGNVEAQMRMTIYARSAP